MASIDAEILGTAPAGRSVGSTLDSIDISTATVDTLTCTDSTTTNATITDLTVTTINGTSTSGGMVTTTGTATLENKSLVDASTAIVDNVDNTITIAFDAAGTTSTTSTLRFAQTANRVYTFPDVATDAQMVLTEGSQTVNGTKTFADIVATTFSTNTISEATPGAGIEFDTEKLNFNSRGYSLNSTVTTTDATPTTLVTWTVPTNAAAIVCMRLVSKLDASSASAVYKSTIRIANYAGAVAGTPFDEWSDVMSALTSSSWAFATSGNDLSVEVTGIAATTIVWTCELHVVNAV